MRFITTVIPKGTCEYSGIIPNHSSDSIEEPVTQHQAFLRTAGDLAVM